MIVTTFRIDGNQRYSWIKNQRSLFVSRTAAMQFKQAFVSVGLPYFNPHSFRKTLAFLGRQRCRTPEEYKAWSQNLGHEHVVTTFCSYGDVSCYRQSEIMRSFASRGIGAAPQDRQVSGAGGNEIHTQRSRGKTLQGA